MQFGDPFENSHVIDEESLRLWDGEQWFEIAFSSCNSQEKVLQWIYYLIDQDWVSSIQVHLFLDAIETKMPDLLPSCIMLEQLQNQATCLTNLTQMLEKSHGTSNAKHISVSTKKI